MKGMAKCILVVFLLSAVLSFSVSAKAPKDILVMTDEFNVVFDVKPMNKDGRILVPFRKIAEALNIIVSWDDKTKTVSAQKDKTSLKLQINNRTAKLNNKDLKMDVPATLIGGRALIPIRVFSEAFECKVSWEETTLTVKIDSPKKSINVLGFYGLGTAETSSWSNLFGKKFPEIGKDNTDIVNNLAFCWFGMDKDGTILYKNKSGWSRPQDWEKVLEVSKKYGMQYEMGIQMTDSDKSITDLISNKESVANAVYQIVYEAKVYSGVNIDFEGLGNKQNVEELNTTKSNFNQFVKTLSKSLKENNLKLTLSLHAPNSWYKGYDYKTLGSLADRIVVMAHDYGTKPEPENKVTEAIELAIKEVPKEKIYLATVVSYEDKNSMAKKLALVNKYGLNGISLWRLGVVKEDVWEMLRNRIETTRGETY